MQGHMNVKVALVVCVDAEAEYVSDLWRHQG
jgi:hypothetical protein